MIAQEVTIFHLIIWRPPNCSDVNTTSNISRIQELVAVSSSSDIPAKECLVNKISDMSLKGSKDKQVSSNVKRSQFPISRIR